MTSDNSEVNKIDDNQIVNWRKRLDTQTVGELADNLANEYDNHAFREWYCLLIYELGPSRINELRGRVKDAKQPGKLFTKLAKEEVGKKQLKRHRNA